MSARVSGPRAVDAVEADQITPADPTVEVGIDIVADGGIRDHVPRDDIAARRVSMVADEHDPLAVAVDHIADDPRASRAGVELDAPVGVVVDPVAADQCIPGVFDVDPMLVIRRRAPAAVVNPILLDGYVSGAGR
jgi:hypothetical protein